MTNCERAVRQYSTVSQMLNETNRMKKKFHAALMVVSHLVVSPWSSSTADLLVLFGG